MQIKKIDNHSQGNSLYPLPPDYGALTQVGQRKARTNAARQWMVPGLSKKEKADAYVASLQFWDAYYLQPDHSADFDPMFYDMAPLPTPKFIGDLYRTFQIYPRSITIAPRGSTKSFSLRRSTSLELVCCPKFTTVYATSSLDNTMAFGQDIKDQVSNNSRIFDDFAPEFPDGRIVPKRGEAPFGTQMLTLRNGSKLRCLSAESKQRGLRPRLYILDDPEYDAKASTSMQVIRDYMETLLFRMVLPMVMRANCGVRWLATFVSKRHYAWHAMSTQAGPDGSRVGTDPRFNLWARTTIRAAIERPDGTLESCWEEMWPSTIARRLEMAKDDERYADVMSLEEIEMAVGTPIFLAEYMARPGEGDTAYFPDLDRDRHGWWLRNVDDLMDEEPHLSNSLICWKEDGEDREMRVCEFLKEARLFMTVDTSYTAGPDSDSKVCTLMGITANNDLFVLDMWSARCHPNQLVTETLRMAARWRCPSIHVEAIKEGATVYEELHSIVRTKAKDMAGVEFLPKVDKLKMDRAEKTAKIATLQGRFRHGHIKLPLERRMEHPWRNLFNQIAEFNPDANDGGLQHDDEIDTVCMSTYVIRGRLARRAFADPERRLSPLESLQEGHTTSSLTGLPYAYGVDWSKVSVQDVMDIVSKNQTRPTGRKTFA